MWKHPPGDEVYRKGAISVFEVDGKKNKVGRHVASAMFDSIDTVDLGPVDALPLGQGNLPIAVFTTLLI